MYVLRPDNAVEAEITAFASVANNAPESPSIDSASFKAAMITATNDGRVDLSGFRAKKRRRLDILFCLY